MIRLARPQIGEEEIDAVTDVLRSGRLVQGAQVAAFEESFAELVDGRPCVAVNSGTSALHLALVALGIGAGDEVVVPSFTFAATANAVRLAGAEPVFVDIEPHHFSLDPDAVAAAVTPRTAAVLPVHLFGHPARTAALGAVAARHGLAVIEDAAQAHASADHGTPVGAWGTAAGFSFYATKNMTTGEGGMVVLSDDQQARTVRMLRNQGMEHQYENELVGYNMRMTDIAAAMGRVQLGRLAAFTARRRANAAALDDGLRGVVTTPAVADGAVHVYHQYTIRSPHRDALQARLGELGVESRVFYPTAVHELAPYRVPVDLPETRRAIGEVLSLPCGPHLDGDDARAVVDAVVAAVGA